MSASVSVVFCLVVAWFVVEFITGDVLPSLGRGGARIRPMDQGSMMLVNLVFYPSLATAFVLSNYNIAVLPEWTFYPGLAIFIAGVLLRQWAVLTLGRYYSEAVGVQEGQPVIDRGPYRRVRHPAYTGVLLALSGIGLALQSWGATLLLAAAFALAFGYRMRVEEKALAVALGEPYVRYMERTKRLIPFIL